MVEPPSGTAQTAPSPAAIVHTGAGTGMRAVTFPVASDTRCTSLCLTHATQAEPKPTASAYCGYGIVAPAQTRYAGPPCTGEPGGGGGRRKTPRGAHERWRSRTASLHL